MKGWLSLITFLVSGTQHLSKTALWWLRVRKNKKENILRFSHLQLVFSASAAATSQSCTAPRSVVNTTPRRVNLDSPDDCVIQRIRPWMGREIREQLLWQTPCLNITTEEAGTGSLPAAHISCVTDSGLGKVLRGELQVWLFLFPKFFMFAITACVTQSFRTTRGDVLLGNSQSFPVVWSTTPGGRDSSLLTWPSAC